MKPFHEIPFFLVNASLSRLVHCSENGPYFRDWALWGSLLDPIGSQFIFQDSIFSVSGVHLRKESEFSLSIQKFEKTRIIDYRSVCDNSLPQFQNQRD